MRIHAQSSLTLFVILALGSGAAAQTETPPQEAPKPAESEQSEVAAQPSESEASGSETSDDGETPDDEAEAAAPAAATSQDQLAPQARRLARSRRGPSSSASAATASRRQPPSARRRDNRPTFRMSPEPEPTEPTLDTGPAPDEPEEESKRDDEQGPVGPILIADLTTQAGQGTFLLGNDYARNPYFDYAVTLQPTWAFEDGTLLNLQIAVTQELTNSDSTTEQRQFLLSDLRLGAARKLYSIDSTKTAFSGELYSLWGTSLASQGETLVTALEGRVTATQPVNDFTFLFRSAYRENFHRYTSPVTSTTAEDGFRLCMARDGGNEGLGNDACTGGGNNRARAWNNRLAVSYTPFESLSFSLRYTLLHSWAYESYDVGRPENCSSGVLECAGSGVGAAEGAGRADSQIGELFATYALRNNIALTAGVATAGATRTSDDERIRFPFFNFEGEENNLTTYFLSVTLTEPVSIFDDSKEEHAKVDSH